MNPHWATNRGGTSLAPSTEPDMRSLSPISPKPGRHLTTSCEGPRPSRYARARALQADDSPDTDDGATRHRFGRKRTTLDSDLEKKDDPDNQDEHSENVRASEFGEAMSELQKTLSTDGPRVDLELRKEVELSKLLVRQRAAARASRAQFEDDEEIERKRKLEERKRKKIEKEEQRKLRQQGKEEEKKIHIERILKTSSADLNSLIKDLHDNVVTPRSRQTTDKFFRGNSTTASLNRRSRELISPVPTPPVYPIEKSETRANESIAHKASSAALSRSATRKKVLVAKKHTHLPPPIKIPSTGDIMQRAPSPHQSKPWNEEFQDLLDTEEASEDDYFNYKAMASLIKDFNSVAAVYGNVIIAEKFIPLRLKTIKPIDEACRSYSTEGILFTFSEDILVGYDEEEAEIWEFGGDQAKHEKAMKMSAHALKGLSCLIHSRVTGLRYPLMAVIHYRGFCLVAQSILPIKARGLVYGSPDRGRTMVNENEEVNDMMIQVGKRLRLVGHNGMGPVGSLQIYFGEDSRFYVTDFEQLLPPEVPLGNNPREVLYHRFRPTFSAKSEIDMCPDALSGTAPELDLEVARASQLLHSTFIPKIAEQLSRTEFNWDLDALVTYIHNEGLCCHHLGYLRSFTEPQETRQALLTEIVARTIKNELRGVLRRSSQVFKTTSEEPYKEAVFEFLKPVLQYQIPAPSYFQLSPSQTSSLDSETNIGPSSISRGNSGPETLCFEANFAIPVPVRQRTFFMEIKIDSESPQFAFGLCGTAPHNNLQDATGYAIDSGGFFRIQGKMYNAPLTLEKGSTFGVLFNWKGKELAFTKDNKIVYVVGVTRGSFIPKLIVGRNTTISFAFSPSFVFDVELFCSRVRIESPIKEDDGTVFWNQGIKPLILGRFANCLSAQEQEHLRSLVDMSALVLRIEQLTSIRLSERVHTYVNVPIPHPFSLAGYDIVSLGSKLKSMDLCYFSEGVVQLLDILEKDSISTGEESLMGSTRALLESVYQHIPIVDPTQYFYIGQMFHWDGVRLLTIDKEESFQSFMNASQVYDQIITHVGDHFETAQMGQVYLQKGILLIDMGKNPREAITLFYRVRGNVDDSILTEQLDRYSDAITVRDEPEQLIRIANAASCLGQCLKDPCNDLACIKAIQVLIIAVGQLYLACEMEFWTSEYDHYIDQICFIFDAVSSTEEGKEAMNEWVKEFFSAEVHHVQLAIILFICSKRPLLNAFVDTHASQSMLVVHPSSLLRAVYVEVQSLITPKSQAILAKIMNGEVDTRAINQWRQIYAAGTHPPYLYGCTFTPIQNLLYLFGGNNGERLFNDLYCYNIKTNHWEKLESPNPPPVRQDHAAVAINDNVILIWGGNGLNSLLDDCYTYDIAKNTWTNVQTRGSPPGARSGFATQKVGNKIYFLGGKVAMGAQGFSEIYILDTTYMSWTTRKTWGKIPSPDYDFMVAYSADDQLIYKYGGKFGGNQLYALHIGSLRWYFINSGGLYPSFISTQDSLSYFTMKDKLIMFGAKKELSCLHLGIIPHDQPLYSKFFTPLGTELSQNNWKECDLTNFPTQDRKYFTSCVSNEGQFIYTHGGQDLKSGAVLGRFQYYHVEENKWYDIESESPDLFGHTINQYKENLYIFGGASSFESGYELKNDLFEVNPKTGTWKKCHISLGSLVGRVFHTSIVFENLLILWGGDHIDSTDLHTLQAVNLDTMQVVPLKQSGEIPRTRDNASWVLRDNKLYLFGGIHFTQKTHSTFKTAHVLDIGSWNWTIQELHGELPEECFAPSFCQYGSYVLKFGGSLEDGSQTDQLSILNITNFKWEANIEGLLSPMEFHHAHTIGKSMYIMESGYEVSFLEIDSGDRLALFAENATSGKRHISKQAAIATVDGIAYVFGGIFQDNVTCLFSALDVDIDCFREQEDDLSTLPPFSSLNRHLKIVAIHAEDLNCRADDQVCDPYISVVDSSSSRKQASNPCNSTLSPEFNHDFFFMNVQSRQDPNVTFEIRDLKDGHLFGSCEVNLPGVLGLANKRVFDRQHDLRDQEQNRQGELQLMYISF